MRANQLLGAALAALGMALPLAGWSAAAEPSLPPTLAADQLYGGEIRFDILRDGDMIGSQRITLERQGQRLTVHAVADIVVRVLSIPVYRFHTEEATEWQDGRLVAVNSHTDDNGKQIAVSAHDQGGRLAVEGSAGRFEAAEPLITMEHWNAAELGQSRLLDPISGKLERVEIRDEGPDHVPAPEGERAVRRFTYGGDVKLTSFYDAAGHWVGLRFFASDGSRIDYVCRRCGPPPGMTAQKLEVGAAAP